MARCENCDGMGHFTEIHFIECDRYQSHGPLACTRSGSRPRPPKCGKCGCTLRPLPPGLALSQAQHAYIDDGEVVACDHCGGSGEAKSFFRR